MPRRKIESGSGSARETLQTALSQLRNITHGLLLEVEDPTEATIDLRDLVLRYGTASDIEIQFSCVGIERVSAPCRRQIYRITQELMSNMVRHSGATRASVRIFPQMQHIVLRYDDDGSGISSDVISRGRGLKNIERRADLMKGETKIGGTNSTTITVTVPVGEPER